MSTASSTTQTDSSKNSKSLKEKEMDPPVPHVNPPALSQQTQLYNLTQDHRAFNMIRVMHLADCITLLNGLCGINSIFASLCYALESSTADPTASSVAQLYWAGAFIPLGLFFDFMDGKVARWRHKSSLMGQELDSLADLISFGAAPAVLAYAFGFRTIMDRLVLSFFFLCGLARLARFNVTAAYLPKDASGKSKYFEGTPIPTTMSLVFVMLYWLSKSQNLDHIPGGVWLDNTVFVVHPTVFMFAVSGCAMVSKQLKVPKI